MCRRFWLVMMGILFVGTTGRTASRRRGRRARRARGPRRRAARGAGAGARAPLGAGRQTATRAGGRRERRLAASAGAGERAAPARRKRRERRREQRAELDGVASEALDDELAPLLEVERFEPPAAFREHALLNDPSVYEQAARDPQAWWAAQAEQLDWFQRWTTVLDDYDPPFYKWFTGGTLNASYNCLDRHVIAGAGERVAFHWRGEDGRGARHHLRASCSRRSNASPAR